MNSELIRYFHCEIEGEKFLSFKEVNEKAVLAGYLVEPRACTKDVLSFLEEELCNYNSTFYETWYDILTKTRFELLMDQLIHYSTTYGNPNVDNEPETVYIPNSEPITIPLKTLRVIKAVSKDYVENKIRDTLSSGIALLEGTLDAFCNFITENKISIDMDTVKNKEAQAYISCTMNILPKDEFGILRCIVYKYTHKAVLIKSREVLATIRGLAKTLGYYDESCPFDFSLLTEENLKRLSRIFYRYKPLFLAFKGKNTPNVNRVINKIRTLAKKNHTPLQKKFWENCFSMQDRSEEEMLEEAKNNVENLSNFKKIRLIQGINERLNGKGFKGRTYLIRNGKQFLKQDYEPEANVKYLKQLKEILKVSLLESLSEKKTTFKMPDNLHITCPTSEKNFIGNYPLGTNIDLSDKDTIVGIYWRNEWGTQDFDLSMVTPEGVKIGWNAHYTNDEDNILYSGDMTNADPEASELIYFKNGFKEDGLLKVNKFWGDSISKFKLFIATEAKDRKTLISKKGMVDLNNIKFETMVDHSNQRELSLGFLHDSKLYLMKTFTGNQHISDTDNVGLIQGLNAIKAASFLDLEEVLSEAGFEKVEENAELDFSDLDKTQLIELFK